MVNPIVSIIIPTYNSGRFIGFTLKSICDQGFKDLEVIIIDDGSTDNTIEIINSFRSKLEIVLIRDEHTADVGKNRNRGLDAARGEYIYFLDSDDIWEPEFIRIYQEHFEKGYKFICSNARVIDENGKITKGVFFEDPDFDFEIKLSDLINLNFIITSSVAIEKTAINNLRFYEEPGFIVEDYIFWLELIDKIPSLFIDKSLVNYRIHNNNFSYKSYQTRIKVLTRTIDIRKKYFTNTDPRVRSQALKGCNPLYEELVLIHLKQKNYTDALHYVKMISYDSKNINLKGYAKFRILFLYLSLINLGRRKRSEN